MSRGRQIRPVATQPRRRRRRRRRYRRRQRRQRRRQVHRQRLRLLQLHEGDGLDDYELGRFTWISPSRDWIGNLRTKKTFSFKQSNDAKGSSGVPVISFVRSRSPDTKLRDADTTTRGNGLMSLEPFGNGTDLVYSTRKFQNLARIGRRLEWRIESSSVGLTRNYIP